MKLVFYSIIILSTILFLQLVISNNDNITASGCLASDPLVLHRLGHALLQLSPLEHKKTRNMIIADDLFQLSMVPVQKTVYVISKAVEKLSGCKFQIFAVVYSRVSLFPNF